MVSIRARFCRVALGLGLVCTSGCFSEPTYLNYVEYTADPGEEFRRNSDNCFIVREGSNPYGTAFVNQGARKQGYFKFTQKEDEGLSVYYYIGEIDLIEGREPDLQTDLSWDDLEDGNAGQASFIAGRDHEGRAVEIFHYASIGDCEDRVFDPISGEEL